MLDWINPLWFFNYPELGILVILIPIAVALGVVTRDG